MIHLVFLLEEESAKELIESLMPRVFPDVSFRCIPFEGKQDLEKNIPIKLRGYKVPGSVFIILRDQDSGDCMAIKARLKDICNSVPSAESLIRIACKELEAWYFGDLKAVEMALGVKNLSQCSKQKKYKTPDCIVNPKKELKSLTKNKYSQVSGSREIGKYINCETNTSDSFRNFISGVRMLLDDRNVIKN